MPVESTSVQDLTRRVRKLEETVAALARVGPRTGTWYLEHAGQFQDDPVYDQIVRRGRAYRRSLRPAQGGSRGANGKKRR